MIKGKAKIELKEPKLILKSIESENLENIQSYTADDYLITEFSFENLNQAISSLDDLINCIDISKEVINKWKN